MSGFVGWAVDAMIASALLMVAVLLVRAPVRRLFGPRVGYALWALPLLRLVLPPLPAGWRSPTAIDRAGDTLVLIITPATGVAPASAPTGEMTTLATSVPLLLAIVWAAGALFFLVHHLVVHLGFCRRIVACAASVEQREGVRVVVSDAAPGPLAFGIWRRYVAFPLDFADRYDADERALALAHEIGHHRRGDLIANWIALGVLALHWFDPIAWRAFRAFRADQELANDAGVIAGRSRIDRHAYACAIVKAAHGGAVSPACHLHTITDLKGRLKMLSMSPASRRRLASGGAAVAMLAVAGLGLTASGSGAAAISAGVKEAAAQAVPPVPPAPAVPAAPAATASDKGPHAVKRVVIVKDGKTTTYDSADIDAHLAAGDRVAVLPPAPGSSRMIVKMDGDPNTRIEVQDIPAVSSANCGIGTGTPASMVIDSGKGNRRKIVICTDRIQQVTTQAVASVNVAEIQRNAMRSALAGLDTARASILSAPGMTDAQRKDALAGIEQAIVEMKEEMKHPEKD